MAKHFEIKIHLNSKMSDFFFETEYFLTCYWRVSTSTCALEQLKVLIETNNLDLGYKNLKGKVRKLHFFVLCALERFCGFDPRLEAGSR